MTKKRLQIMPGCRIDKIDKMTDDVFWGEYKGHAIEIDRDTAEGFHIIVTSPDGCYAYYGWWQPGRSATIRDAVEEALQGSGIID